MNSTQVPPTRRAALTLALAGLLMGLGGVLHPRVDTKAEFEDGLVGMFESGAWAPSHLLTMAGFATAAAALAGMARTTGASWSPRMRTLTYVAAAAAGIAAIESVPHVLAATEADAVRAGDAAPLTDLHTTIQALSTVAVGVSFAALAFVGKRTRTLDAGRIATTLAVIGGTVFAAAGPVIAITHDPSLSPLFAGSAGLAIWMLVCGVKTARRASAAAPQTPTTLATARSAR